MDLREPSPPLLALAILDFETPMEALSSIPRIEIPISISPFQAEMFKSKYLIRLRVRH
jgi:hypothetical protein